MMNSPCAIFTTFICPKVKVRPSATSSRMDARLMPVNSWDTQISKFQLRPLAQAYDLRYGSGSIGLPEFQISLIRPSLLMIPMRAVLETWWLSPFTVTRPSGALKVMPPAAALDFAGYTEL